MKSKTSFQPTLQQMSRNDSHNVSISDIYKRPKVFQDQWPVSTTNTIPISQRYISQQETFKTLARKKRDQRYLMRMGCVHVQTAQEKQSNKNETERNPQIIIGAAFSINERKNGNSLKKHQDNHISEDSQIEHRSNLENSLSAQSAIPNKILESNTMLIQDMLQAQERLQAAKKISNRTQRQMLHPIKNTSILSKDLSHLDIYQQSSPYQDKTIWPSSSLSPKHQNSRNNFHQQANLKLMKQRLLPIIPKNNSDLRLTHQNFKLEWDSTVVNNQFVEVKLEQFSRNNKQHKNHKSLNENCGAPIFPPKNMSSLKSKERTNSPSIAKKALTPLKTVDIELPNNYQFLQQNQPESPLRINQQQSIVNESVSPNIQVLRRAIRDARLKQALLKDLSRRSQHRDNKSFGLDQSIMNNGQQFKQTVQETIKEFNQSRDRLRKKSDICEKQGILKFRLHNEKRNKLMEKINQLATTEQSFRYEDSSILRQLEQQQKLGMTEDQQEYRAVSNKKVQKRINNLRIEPWEEISTQWKISSEGSPNP